MDGVHDLGGREGFGAIRDKHDERPFRADWEMRAFGLAQASGGDANWSIDWFRHCRELIVPTEYMTRPYFDQWLVTIAAQMIDAGYVTMAEIVAGKSAFTPQPGYPPATAEEARAYAKEALSYAVEVDSPPAFAVGDAVSGKPMGHSGHTRLPAYVRGRRGTVFAHHGAHVLPDASAAGTHEGEHLYTVRFAASELWPEARDRRDQVFVDLWESYLEPA
jgi:nitrile hydratase